MGRRAKRDEKRRREEWRKAWKQEKRKKVEVVPAKPEAEPVSEDESDGNDDSSDDSRRQKITKDAPVLAKMDNDQKKFWAQKVKGCVSHDNKGFTDADLERRLRAQ